jgi:hypothetical protein
VRGAAKQNAQVRAHKHTTRIEQTNRNEERAHLDIVLLSVMVGVPDDAVTVPPFHAGDLPAPGAIALQPPVAR